MEYPIYYLAHPYSDNPTLSQGFAENYTNELIRKGFFVFSPILHTHHFEMSMRKKYDNVKAIWDAPNYVAWDLILLGGFMNYDGTLGHGKCPQCGWKMSTYHKNFWCLNCDSDMKEIKQKFDSGVIMLMSNTAYRKWVDFKVTDEKFGLLIDGTWHEFISKGCEKEFRFAKSHHIRVLELEAFLEGKEVDL